jgi:hypothetical protein
MKNIRSKILIGVGIFIVCVLVISSTTSLAQSVKQTIEVQFDKIKIEINGEKASESTILYNNTTYVPLRFVSEKLDSTVQYDSATSTAKINSSAIPAGPPTGDGVFLDTEEFKELYEVVAVYRYNISRNEDLALIGLLGSQMPPQSEAQYNQMVKQLDKVDENLIGQWQDYISSLTTIPQDDIDTFISIGDYVKKAKQSIIEIYADRAYNNFTSGKKLANEMYYKYDAKLSERMDNLLNQ